jgi:hypothetical protein
MLQGVASSALYWPVDEVGSQTPNRLRPGDLSLYYTSCRIPSICFRRSPPRSLSCTPSLEVVGNEVVRSVGPTDRSVGLLVGRTHLSGMAVSLVGGDPGVPMSHKPPSEVYPCLISRRAIDRSNSMHVGPKEKKETNQLGSQPV